MQRALDRGWLSCGNTSDVSQDLYTPSSIGLSFPLDETPVALCCFLASVAASIIMLLGSTAGLTDDFVDALGTGRGALRSTRPPSGC